MIIRILKPEYLKSEHLYDDFVLNNIINDLDHFSGESVSIPEVPPFPLYLPATDEDYREKRFFEAVNIIKIHYAHLNRDILMSQEFWQSLFLTEFREYAVTQFPNILKSKNSFNNIIMKSFDWENYIYKMILAVQYVTDQLPIELHEKYLKLIIKNLDVYNYLLKNTVFRNDKFVISFMTIIEKNNLSNQLKEKIKYMPKDERYGRRVIFEFSKDYPVILSPMMDEQTFELTFIKHLKKYVKTPLNQLVNS